MKKQLILFIALFLIPAIAYANQCTDNNNLGSLATLKNEKFEIKSATVRNETAIKLLSCIGYHDPKIRDGVVYEGISLWLRNGLLERQTIQTMFTLLIKMLEKTNLDPENLTQPFAALVISEVIRVDRIDPFLSDDDRQKIVDVSTNYMSNIEDYRGFDDSNGWRHAVAHSADIFLQLALNKNISKNQLDLLLDAITIQVSPKKRHFYIYGEPKRLAMAFIYIVLRREHTEQDISTFFNRLVNPTPFTDWNAVYSSNDGLAKLHNTRHFVYSVFAITAQSQNPKLKVLQPILINIIKALG